MNMALPLLSVECNKLRTGAFGEVSKTPLAPMFSISEKGWRAFTFGETASLSCNAYLSIPAFATLPA